MKKFWWITSGFLGVGAIAIAVLLLAPKPPLSPKTIAAANFSIWASTSRGVTTDRTSAAYDAHTHYLRYRVTIGGTPATVNEQPAPAEFVDEASTAFTKFIKSLGEDTAFEVQAGVVHLVRPIGTNTRQAAVINAKGTLVFVQPESELSQDAWRSYFKNFSPLN